MNLDFHLLGADQWIFPQRDNTMLNMKKTSFSFLCFSHSWMADGWVGTSSLKVLWFMSFFRFSFFPIALLTVSSYNKCHGMWGKRNILASSRRGNFINSSKKEFAGNSSSQVDSTFFLLHFRLYLPSRIFLIRMKLYKFYSVGLLDAQSCDDVKATFKWGKLHESPSFLSSLSLFLFFSLERNLGGKEKRNAEGLSGQP